MEKQFENYLNYKVPFYGVCGNQFKLGDVIFEAIENPGDGYRPYLDSIQIIKSKEIFSKYPMAIVEIKKSKTIEGYNLTDVYNNHVWLKIGTNHGDNWDPYFIFDFQPLKNINDIYIVTWQGLHGNEFIKQIN